ncbi:MAG: lipopolysaccharide biosynthesis protein [Chromatiales bacterium]|nr:lipopolysaccharide biosynthesis protein [Chromatiales bacterium]
MNRPSGKAIRSGLSWQTASVVVQALMQVIVLAVLARLLDPGDFGLAAVAAVAVTFGVLLSEAGTSSAVVQRYQPLDSAFISSAFLVSVAIGATLFVAQAFLAPTLEGFFGMPGLAPILVALGSVFVINGFSRVPEAMLQRELRFALLMKVNFAAQILGYAVPAVLLAWAGFGVWALVGGTLCQAFTKALLFFAVTRSAWGFRPSRAALWEVSTFGLGMTKIKFWNWVMQQGDRFIIGRRMDADALGQYQVIIQLARMPGQYIANVLDSVFFPVLARYQGKREQLVRTYLLLASNSYVFMLALGLFMAANGELLVRLLLGEQWLSSVPLFQVFCLAAGIRIFTRIGDMVNRALGQVYAASMRKMLLACLYLAAVWLTVPYGLLAVVIAVVSCQLVGALLISELAWRGIGIRFTEAASPLLRALLWSAALLILNITAWQLLQRGAWSAGPALAGSVIVHAALAAFFLRPLLPLLKLRGEAE